MMNTTYSNLFASAKSNKEYAEATKRFTMLADIVTNQAEMKANKKINKKWFYLLINETKTCIQICAYKEQNLQRANELEAQIESMERELESMLDVLSSSDEQVQMLNNSINKLKQSLNWCLNTEMSTWYYLIKNREAKQKEEDKKKSVEDIIPTLSRTFTEDDIRYIASQIYVPGKEVTVRWFEFRMWASLAFNDHICHITDYRPNRKSDIEIVATQKATEYENSKIKDSHSELKQKHLQSYDEYMDVMDSDWESL